LYPHRIRLREPWEREPLAGGGLRYRRYFNAPTIVAGEAVWIVCETIVAVAAVSLNDAPLGNVAMTDSVWEHEVTPLVVTRNSLTFDFAAAPAGDNLPWTEVRLEIRRAT
jgi:hypothetical protein